MRMPQKSYRRLCAFLYLWIVLPQSTLFNRSWSACALFYRRIIPSIATLLPPRHAKKALHSVRSFGISKIAMGNTLDRAGYGVLVSEVDKEELEEERDFDNNGAKQYWRRRQNKWERYLHISRSSRSASPRANLSIPGKIFPGGDFLTG